MEPHSSLPHSHNPAICPHPETDHYSPGPSMCISIFSSPKRTGVPVRILKHRTKISRGIFVRTLDIPAAVHFVFRKSAARQIGICGSYCDSFCQHEKQSIAVFSVCVLLTRCVVGMAVQSAVQTARWRDSCYANTVLRGLRLCSYLHLPDIQTAHGIQVRQAIRHKYLFARENVGPLLSVQVNELCCLNTPYSSTSINLFIYTAIQVNIQNGKKFM